MVLRDGDTPESLAAAGCLHLNATGAGIVLLPVGSHNLEMLYNVRQYTPSFHGRNSWNCLQAAQNRMSTQ